MGVIDDFGCYVYNYTTARSSLMVMLDTTCTRRSSPGGHHKSQYLCRHSCGQLPVQVNMAVVTSLRV